MYILIKATHFRTYCHNKNDEFINSLKLQCTQQHIQKSNERYSYQ